MTDDHWVVSPEEMERLGSFKPSESDTLFARAFAAIAQALDKCEHSGDVTLLLSTCRNEYLVVNAIFTDLRMCVSQRSNGQSLFDRLIAAVSAGTVSNRSGSEVRKELGLLLKEARGKRRVWDSRVALWDEYETAVAALPDLLSRQDARSVLTSSPPIPHDDGVWPGQYTRMSKDETTSHLKLETLTDITQELSATFELLDLIGSLNVKLTDEEVEEQTLFDDPDKSAAPVEPPSIDWTPVIAAVEQRGAWYSAPGPAGGTRFAHRNLPEPDERGWPDSSTVRSMEIRPNTLFGGDTTRQLSNVLGFAATAVAHARFLLRRSFTPNAARLPMPAPFVVDLTTRDPLTRNETAPREFRRNITQVEEGERRADHARVAILKVAVPEPWHNHERYYHYDPSIANVQFLVSLIKTAIEKAADSGAHFLFLPECFIPRNALTDIKTHAAQRQVNVIGGVEARLDDPGHTVNETLIWFPDETPAASLGGLELFQKKQGPSIFETGRAGFAHDARLHVVKNTLIGNLGVVVCSDYLEADLMSALAVADAPRLHALAVIARNPSQSVFNALAHADAIRLYAHVIVCNSTDGTPKQLQPNPDGGCLVAAPKGQGFLEPDDRVLLGRLADVPADFPEPELMLWELEVAGIHSRNNRGDSPGWLKASDFAKRGR